MLYSIIKFYVKTYNIYLDSKMFFLKYIKFSHYYKYQYIRKKKLLTNFIMISYHDLIESLANFQNNYE